LRIGIEDNADQPPADQRISDELMEQIRKRVAELTVNVQVAPELAQRTIRRALEELVAQGQVQFEGERRWRRYSLVDKGQSP
jgi:DNA-binding transcriptional ArsR family regulator